MFRSYREALFSDERFYSNPGERIEAEYGLTVDKFGNQVVDVVGKRNTYEYIQSNRDSGDISLILARYRAGDLSALNARSAFYADVTNMPSNYAEYVQRIAEADKIFDSLPLDVKEHFNFSSGEFWSKFGSDEFNEFFNNSKVVPEVVPEVVISDVIESVDIDEQKQSK